MFLVWILRIIKLLAIASIVYAASRLMLAASTLEQIVLALLTALAIYFISYIFTMMIAYRFAAYSVSHSNHYNPD